MTPNKSGQIVRFHTPLPDEKPEQLYVVLDINIELDRPRVKIQALNTGLEFPPVNIVLLHDLEIVEVDTSDLIGNVVFIKKGNTKIIGRVTKINDSKINLDLLQNLEGVNTNVYVTIVDKDGVEHVGTLFVS